MKSGSFFFPILFLLGNVVALNVEDFFHRGQLRDHRARIEKIESELRAAAKERAAILKDEVDALNAMLDKIPQEAAKNAAEVKAIKAELARFAEKSK